MGKGRSPAHTTLPSPKRKLFSFFNHRCSLSFASENKLLSGLTLTVAIINQNQETLSGGGIGPDRYGPKWEVVASGLQDQTQ